MLERKSWSWLMKVGDLVMRKEAIYKPDWGAGVIVSYDGFGMFKVFWSKWGKHISHDMYQLVSYESR